MAKNTPLELRNLNIYSVFTRNFSSEGTFKEVRKKSDWIKSIGTDVIWFLPFYPIGEKNKKGAVGSPYAIRDYRAVDSTHGSIDDFIDLVDEIHNKGMKVMIDIVFNHTAPDSVLADEHPDWFFKTENGTLCNQVGDWTDIVDLDYSNEDLWDYQIETLVHWAELVDGFRCDVAPLIPVSFWNRARAAVSEVKPDFIWLAESIERPFLQDLRNADVLAQSDGEMYQAFDLSYDYDVYTDFKNYLLNEAPLSKYVYALNLQESSYPENYVKLKFLENHDQERIAALVNNKNDLLQWTAFNYLQKGATLVYNGQSVLSKSTPSLFEKDPIQWDTGYDISDYMAHFSNLQKEHVPIENNRYELKAFNELDTIIMYYDEDQQKKVGVFNVKEQTGHVPVEVADGEYHNLIDDRSAVIQNGALDLKQTPAFFIAEK